MTTVPIVPSAATTRVHVRAFAAARAALGAPALDLDVPARDARAGHVPATVHDVVAALLARVPDAADVVARCSVLVDGTRSDADAPVPAGAVIDLLPPFAGG
ncbi:MoaD/ThiS family protein [Luteimicrobium subarcticum]|uniref:Molybdopterin converting factor small subunit n=1 Tax=Luteimicrobium subarcticum TaxID=620910 RepID=A0A2M8W1E3_9MICO|nr:MoaD/ThiS family protein [Luteimicrobium subarcticum]PJI84736.1 molybdopterin converting factor small subunit [Luteimicrobium subarcticum]